MSTKPTTKKKILALLLSLAMVVTMIPLGVFGDNASSGSDTYKNYYKIAHLDCGRKYFSVDYIKGMIDTMYANGYNQLELAIGNGGLRFVLDDMDLTYGEKTLFYSNEVKKAIKEGNEAFYNDPNGNYLTEAEMNTIISYANTRDIQIVPLLNMPGHMDGILSSSKFSQYKLSGSDGSLDLNNAYAVEFGKALLTKYVEYFRDNGCKFFNFGADEYGQGIRNPYIESNVAKVTYDQLISYMNDCAKIIEDAKMTARAFNDFVCYNKRTSCNLYKTVEICYWSNQWNGSEYNTAKVIKNAGYKLINTNQKWYFVPSKASEYGKATVLSNFKTFDVTKFQNIESGYNSTSTTYTEIPVGSSNVGSMFCVWCDEPSVDVAAGDVNDLLKAFSDANPNCFTKNTAVNTIVGDKNGNTTLDDSSDNVRVEGLGLTRLTLSDIAARTIENAKNVISYDVKPGNASGYYTGDGTVYIRIPEGWDKSNTRAYVITDGKVETKTGVIEDTDWYKFDVEHFSEMGLYEIDPSIITYDKEIKLKVGKSTTETQKDVNNANNVDSTNLNSSIATVTVEGTDEVAGTATYSKVSVRYNQLASQDTSDWKDTGYYYKSGNNYYKLYVKRSEQYNYGYTSYSYTFGYGNNSSNVTSLDTYNTWWTSDYFYGFSIYNQTGATDPEPASTTITFTGVAPGETYVKVGNTTYKIIVEKNTVAETLQVGSTKTYDGETGTPEIQGEDIVTATIENGKLKVVAKAVGTAVITTSKTVYTITVTKQDLSTVTLPINLWITNTGVNPTGWDENTSDFSYTSETDSDGKEKNIRSIYTLKASRGGVYSENGIELSSILPNKSGTAKSWDGNTYDVRYWKNAYHTSETRQSTDGWTNNSHKGTTFKYIRYWDNNWAYSADGVLWTDIENVGAEAADKNKNQVNIWYRQKTEITKEVETEIVDWGPVKYSANQCLLDFAVKYESGERTPDNFPVSGKTMGFDCPTNQDTPLGNGYVVKDGNYYYRTVYGIAGVETSEYEVYMITVTPSADAHGTYINNGSTPSSYKYAGTEKVAWAKTEADAANSGLGIVDKGTDHIEMSYGGEPFLESVKIYRYQGLLVTYYVRALDGLKVHYINENTNEEFYNYNISVKQGTVFDNDIRLQPGENWKGPLANGSVENSKGITQTVSADLSTMPAIGAQYRYSDYTCTKVERKTDGKEVYLYYKFTNEKTYVVDYGLKLNIGLSDLNSNLTGAGVKIESVEAVGAEYATLTVGENNSVEYKLNEMLSEQDTFTITVRGSLVGNSGGTIKSVTYNITVIPATTVYYEDDFGTISYSGKWEAVPDRTSKTPDTAVQALDELGKSSSNNYGYDPVYGNYKTYSMGSAMKTTVSENTYNTNKTWPKATFSFKGTGFDVISLTDNNSGAVYVTVKDKKGTAVSKKFVNNYYGYSYSNGTWTATPGTDDNALYQIPVMKITGLEYGEYDVEIMPVYSKYFDKTGDGEYSFWLDAVRIYDPAGASLDSRYDKDKEKSPSYKKIKDILLDANDFNKSDDSSIGAVFVDGVENNTDLVTYANQGPNNEVYLKNGQGIAFKLVTDDKSKVQTVQIGAKLANGNSGTLYSNAFSTTETTKTIGTATDMYYKLNNLTWGNASNGKYESNVITFKNNSDSIISLTNVKVTGGAKIVDNTAAATNNYVMLMASPAIAKEAADIMNNVPSSGGSSLPSVKPGSEDTQLPELPKIISVKADKSVIGKGSKAVIRITVSENTEYITVNDELVTDFTVVEKNGVKYKVFTYKNTEKVKGNKEYTVVAYGSDNLSGKQETAMVKVTVFKPGKFTVSVKAKKVKKNQKASLTVKTSKNTKYITVNGKKITKYTKQGKYKVWKYSKKYTKTGTKSFKVVAYDSKKIPSDTKKAVVKVVR